LLLCLLYTYTGYIFVKQFIDFIPLILFFIVFKLTPRPLEVFGHTFSLGGIYSATAILIIVSIIVYGAIFIKQRKLDNGQMITLAACLLLGGLTLTFHSDIFIKLKAPIVNWIFALAFLGSQYIGKEPIIQRLMGKAISLPNAIWRKLNIAWVIFFIICGSANLFVAFTFDSIWVTFKVFGSLAMTIIFMLGQAIYLAPHIKEQESNHSKE